MSVVAGGLILATPITAWAKGSYHVKITGPGLAGPVAVRGGDAAAWPQMTGFYNQTGEQVPPPGTRLGPRYVARVRGGGEDTLVQHLYPYAEDGPYMYTPPGQRFAGAPEGWNHTGTDLLDALIRAGLPPRDDLASSGVEAPSSGPREDPIAQWFALLVVTVATGGIVWLAQRGTLRRSAG